MGLAQPNQLLGDPRICLPRTGAGPPGELVEALLPEAFKPVDPFISGLTRDIEPLGQLAQAVVVEPVVFKETVLFARSL
jgi:hypothetical protein